MPAVKQLIDDAYVVEMATSPEDLRAAQRLRYEVFVQELGASGPGVDHQAFIETDAFDPHCDHLLLRTSKGGPVIGAYRVMRSDQAKAAGRFYSEAEFDLGNLLATDHRLLELGRSCLHKDHRGGAGLFQLWSGLVAYVQDHDIDVLFGVASLQGTDVMKIADQLSLLHHRYAAPQSIAPVSRAYQRLDLRAEPEIDRRNAMVGLPSLIKSYLRLGGRVGDGAFVDHDFNCTDVCMVLETARINQQVARLYGIGRRP